MTVRIIDATLREGMQAPGVAFDAEASCRVAALLARAGVDAVECGHPAKSPAEQARVRAVASAGWAVPVLTHARAHPRDIDEAKASGAAWVGLFLGVNETSRRSRVPGRTLRELLAVIADAVARAKDAGLRVRFTCEDASRTPTAERLAAYRAAIDAGADRICFADTVGVLEPPGAASAVAEIVREFPALPVEVHLHDDRGLAVANALAAVDAGATWVSSSMNGLGERCGIVDTAVLLANLHARGLRPLAEPGILQEASRVVAEAAGVPLSPQHPVTGRHAFTHRARLHVLAMAADKAAYSWIAPEAVGREAAMVPDDRDGGA